MGMFQTAFDAAGHENQECISVAGFISSVSDWIAFDKAWRERLMTEGLTYFRMSEFAQSSGSFSESAAWSEIRRRRLFGDLLGIIQRHAYRKFGCSVTLVDFAKLSDDMKRHYRLSGYALCGRTTAGHVRQWALEERLPNAPIAYIFEDGDKGKGNLIERMEKDAFPAPVFWPKKDGIRDGIERLGFTPLQAADILAYELFLATKRSEPKRWAFLELDRSPPGVLYTYTAENLQALDETLRRYSDIDVTLDPL
jgi:hypothetical protein